MIVGVYDTTHTYTVSWPDPSFPRYREEIIPIRNEKPGVRLLSVNQRNCFSVTTSDSTSETGTNKWNWGAGKGLTLCMVMCLRN